MSNQTPPTYGPPPQQSGSGFFNWIRSLGLVRSQDRWLGGVSSGIARRLNIDPFIVRGIFLITLLLGGFGLLLYGIAWVLLPDDTTGRIHFEALIHGDFDWSIVAAAIMVVVGLARPDNWGWSWLSIPLWVGIIIVLIVLLQQGKSQRRAQAAAGYPPAGGYPPPPAPGTGYAPMSTTGPQDASAAEATAPKANDSAAAAKESSPTTTTSSTTPPQSGNTQSTSTAYVPPSQGARMSSTPPPPPMYRQTAPYPPPPPVPSPRAAGKGTVLATLAAIVLIIAASIFIDWASPGAFPIALICVASILGVVGLALMVTGFRGRTSGLLGLFAILALIASPSILVIDTEQVFSHETDMVWTPRTVDEAKKGRDQVAGDLKVDLTELELRDHESVDLNLSLVAGSMTIILPDDVTTSYSAEVFAGRILENYENGPIELSGVSVESSGSSSGDTDNELGRYIEVDAEVTFGSIAVKKEN